MTVLDFIKNRVKKDFIKNRVKKDFIKNRVKKLYRANPNIHVNLSMSHPGVCVENARLII